MSVVKERLSYDAVEGLLERRISARVDWATLDALGVLGLDEIALKKGHRDFVAIVTARLASGRVVVLAVLPDRLKETVKTFLLSIPEPLRRTIHTVCTDTCGAVLPYVGGLCQRRVRSVPTGGRL